MALLAPLALMSLPALLACSKATSNHDTAPELVDTWSGEVSLDSDVVVEAGHTLVIESGTVVTAADGVALIVDGELDVRGLDYAPVTFTSAGTWAGITFMPDSVPAQFDGVDSYNTGSIVEYAVVESATRGMYLNGAAPYLHAVTFQKNIIAPTVDTVGGAGLLIDGGARPRVRECVFQDNKANVFAYGGGVYVDKADPIFQDDVFTSNAGSYGGAIATDLMASPIVGSTFTENESDSDGGAISLVSSVSTLLGNTITGNHAVYDAGGVHVCVDCYPHAAPYLYDNAVTGNLTDAADPEDGAAGVGAAFLGGFVHNDLHDNLGSGQPSDLAWFNLVAEAWPDWVASPVLEDVWWGTTDPDAIAATIHDGADDATHPEVSLGTVRDQSIGALPGAASVRAVIASRKTLYEDAGDDMPVFLTVYNPGPDTEVLLTITATSTGTLPTVAVDYPGAVDNGDGTWTLDLPENTVWFGTIADGTYDGTAVDDVTWTATLSDDGGVVGVPVVARYLTQPAS